MNSGKVVAGGWVDGEIEGSTRGPRGPENCNLCSFRVFLVREAPFCNVLFPYRVSAREEDGLRSEHGSGPFHSMRWASTRRGAGGCQDVIWWLTTLRKWTISCMWKTRIQSDSLRFPGWRVWLA